MDNWDDLKFFLSLSRHGSLKASAKDLKTDQATVGRRIYGLQEKLKTNLFEKRSDGYFLTTAGERIKATAEMIEASFQSIDRKITGQDEKMEGAIRLAMPGALADHLIIPGIKKFAAQFPEINMQFITGAETVNLTKREADMAFRLVRPEQNELVVRKIGDMSLSLYGSKGLFEKNGKISQLEHLKALPFVGLYENSISKAEAALFARIKKYLGPQALTTSAWNSVYSALHQGIGVGVLPDFMTNQTEDLQKISFVGSEKTPLWFVIHPEVQKNKRFMALSEFLLPVLKREIL